MMWVTKHWIGRVAVAVVGRKRLARVGRFLESQARLDLLNDMEANGELIVQRGVVRNADEPVVVFDVGAHHGEWILRVLNAASGASRKISAYAFEPAAASHAHLVSAVRSRVQVERMALSDHPGTAELRITYPDALTNSLHSGDRPHRQTGIEEVRLTTVDLYCDQAGVDRIACLKVDTEGHDLAVLRGAGRMLSEQLVDVVQFEYGPRWIDAGSFLKESFEFLVPSGYAMGKVTPRGVERYRAWHPDLENFRESNYLAWLPRAASWFPSFEWWG